MGHSVDHVINKWPVSYDQSKQRVPSDRERGSNESISTHWKWGRWLQQSVTTMAPTMMPMARHQQSTQAQSETMTKMAKGARKAAMVIQRQQSLWLQVTATLMTGDEERWQAISPVHVPFCPSMMGRQVRSWGGKGVTTPKRIIKITADDGTNKDIEETVATIRDKGHRESELDREDAGWRAWARELATMEKH